MRDRTEHHSECQCKHGINFKNARCIQCASESTSHKKANARHQEQAASAEHAIKRAIDRANKRDW